MSVWGPHFPCRRCPITYNRSEGIKFGSSEAERAFLAQLRVAAPLQGRDFLKQLPKDPVRALPLIEYFLLYGFRFDHLLLLGPDVLERDSRLFSGRSAQQRA
jgi:hypothetical protein